MKIEEMLILGLTGTAAYLVWRMRSQKPAMVTQSITAPVMQSPVSSAVVPVGSQQPSLPTMTSPKFPEPIYSPMIIPAPPPSPPSQKVIMPTAPKTISVAQNETVADALLRSDLDVNCIPNNVTLDLKACAAGMAREALPVPAIMFRCASGEKEVKQGVGKCINKDEEFPQRKRFTAPTFCVPENQSLDPVEKCPDGQARTRQPCPRPGYYPARPLEDVLPEKACPPGYKFNRAAIPCRVCPPWS